MTLLLIARHGNNFEPGETPRRVGARTDLPLSASGVEQAKQLGRYLAAQDLKPDAVFTSNLERTQATARFALAVMDHMVAVTPRAMFNEVDYGPDEDKPEDAVIARIGKPALDAWDSDGDVPPGWLADPAAIRKNWLDFGAEIARGYDGRIVLAVTSNGIARFAPVLTGDEAGFRATFKPKIATGALCILQHDGAGWFVKDWNIRP